MGRKDALLDHHDGEKRYQAGGVFINAKGLILTTYDFVKNFQFDVFIRVETTDPSNFFRADVEYTDESLRIAVLKVTEEKIFDYVAFADDINSSGHFVYFGHTYGIKFSYVEGVICTRSRWYAEVGFHQLDNEVETYNHQPEDLDMDFELIQCSGIDGCEIGGGALFNQIGGVFGLYLFSAHKFDYVIPLYGLYGRSVKHFIGS
ncbi:hypothetical protein Ancab_001227 [Ancistrocladus abbreviatus]